MAMTERSVTHGSFRLERTYDARPARVFRAFSDVAAKKAWFTGSSEADELERTMDFRVGGRERVVGRWNGERISSFECLYYDIIENERIIYSYEMHQDDIKISVSLATLEFRAEGAGTRLGDERARGLPRRLRRRGGPRGGHPLAAGPDRREPGERAGLGRREPKRTEHALAAR
jgi:uncharacterized protein YndB with AHSA1/START domain